MPARAIIIAGLATVLLASPATLRAANPPQPFPYEMQMTPEEGPLDPKIEARHTRDFQACQQRALRTDQNAACFEAEFARQDATLNIVWKSVVARMPAERRIGLLAAQRKWVASRDPFCKSAAAKFSGGTISPVIYSDCRVEQTIRRAIWLENLK